MILASSKAPRRQKSWLKGRSLHVRRRMHHGSGVRAAFLMAGSDRQRAALHWSVGMVPQAGLGLGLVKWFARQASQFGYHGTRTDLAHPRDVMAL